MRSSRILLLELPETNYGEALDLQRRIVRQKLSKGGPDVVMLLEHPPTITLGMRARDSDLLLSRAELAVRGVEVCNTDRGGQATYHGPGQLVCYPILDLRRLGLSVRDYVNRLEETVICALASFGILGIRMKGKPGVWTGSREKIASIGVRIERRVTSHGFSLNVSQPIDPGALIVSCGDPGIRAVNVQQLTVSNVSMSSMKATVATCLSRIFGMNLEPTELRAALDPPFPGE
jgi:lipoate-protein ligase B